MYTAKSTSFDTCLLNTDTSILLIFTKSFTFIITNIVRGKNLLKREMLAESGWMGGWMEGWKEERTDRPTDGYKAQLSCSYFCYYNKAKCTWKAYLMKKKIYIVKRLLNTHIVHPTNFHSMIVSWITAILWLFLVERQIFLVFLAKNSQKNKVE